MQNFFSTRRQFLTHGAVALAGVSAFARRAYGMHGMSMLHRVIPQTSATGRTTFNSWLPDAPADDLFRTLALVAMDAAKQAGTDFADIRIGVQRECGSSQVSMLLGYGIRARVGGTWGFQHGNVLTSDALATAARAAVAAARTAAKVNERLAWHIAEPIASVPVVTGEWKTPIEIDPFAIPMDEFWRMDVVLGEEVERFGLSGAHTWVSWTNETRIFASTAGSLVTQSFTRGGPLILRTEAHLGRDDGGVGLPVTRPDGESAGFEVMFRKDYSDRIIASVEEAIRWEEIPLKPFNDVGRYPVVFGGIAFASIIANTLNLALDGDRLSGNESDASGRSFLQPFSAHPTQSPPEFSELLTITSHRNVPSSTAVGWDDDGVAPTPSTLVDKGTVVDFWTTRETAPLFQSWYQARNRTVQLHGNTVAPTPASVPMSIGGEVSVAPSAQKSSEAELYRDMKHGFFIKTGVARAAPGLTTGTLFPSLMVEIVNGKPVNRVQGPTLAFLTNAVLRTGLLALGDATTLGTSTVETQKGMPWQRFTNPVTAPAAHCKEVDLLRTGVRI